MEVTKVSENEEERVTQTFTIKPEGSENAKKGQTRSKGLTRGMHADSDQQVISSKYVDPQDIKVAGRYGT